MGPTLKVFTFQSHKHQNISRQSTRLCTEPVVGNNGLPESNKYKYMHERNVFWPTNAPIIHGKPNVLAWHSRVEIFLFLTSLFKNVSEQKANELLYHVNMMLVDGKVVWDTTIPFESSICMEIWGRGEGKKWYPFHPKTQKELNFAGIWASYPDVESFFSNYCLSGCSMCYPLQPYSHRNCWAFSCLARFVL